MSKNLNSQQMMSIERMAEQEFLFNQNSNKNIFTTKYTQGQANFFIPKSFILGKNVLLENNTSSELDSSNNESDLSFEERLHSCHEKNMVHQILKYLELKDTLRKTKSFDFESLPSSTEMMKDIEKRVLEELKQIYGSNEAEKIRLTIKFMKRSENLTKIYFEVVKRLPSNFQTSIFILFKHSVIAYLEARKQKGEKQSKISQETIKHYLEQNFQNIFQQIEKDQKLQLIFNPEIDQGLQKTFKFFLKEWMQGFFLAKEGFPCTEFKEGQNIPVRGVRMKEDRMQNKQRKKLKKL